MPLLLSIAVSNSFSANTGFSWRVETKYRCLPSGSNTGLKSLSREALTRVALPEAVLYSQIERIWLASVRL